MLVTPLVKKGNITAPMSRGDILNNCYPFIQDTEGAATILATKIAAGDILLRALAENPQEILLPTAEELCKAIKGNIEKTSPLPTSSYINPQSPKFDLVNEVDKAQSGSTFSRLFFGELAIDVATPLKLLPNTGIFFTEQGLSSLSAGGLFFASQQWRILVFEIVNSSLPIAMKGSTPAGGLNNAVQVDKSIIAYVTVGMSLYTSDATIFNSTAGEVKVTNVDYQNAIIYFSADNVISSTGFIFNLTPTINVTPLADSSAGTSSTVWGSIIGTLADQTDLNTVLSGIATDITTIEGDITTINAAITAIEADIVILEAGIVLAGTSFPGTPAVNQRFYRTDRSLEYFWNGTRWLTTQQYTMRFGQVRLWLNVSANADMGYGVPAFADTYEFWMEELRWSSYIVTTNDGTRYWTVALYKYDAATLAGIGLTGTVNTSADGANVYKVHTAIVGSLLANTSDILRIDMNKTSTPGNLTNFDAILVGRLVG